MAFSSSTSSVLYSYNIDSIKLSRDNGMKDFGAIPSIFHFHVGYVISKSLSMLGFIQCSSSEITDPSTILFPNNSLVRSYLEYCSVIWNPIYVSNCFRIEKVQKKFARFLIFHIKLANGEAMLSKKMCVV